MWKLPVCNWTEVCSDVAAWLFHAHVADRGRAVGYRRGVGGDNAGELRGKGWWV